MKYIVRTYSVVTPESCADGDYAEHGWADFAGNRFPLRDEHGYHPENAHTDRALIGHEITPDPDEDLTAVDVAVDFLKFRCYVSEPSSYPTWAPGTWYSSEPDANFGDGSDTTYSYHLYGFTEDEQRLIYGRLFGGVR